jgi:ABC-type multidrug transport system ATPase subunit
MDRGKITACDTPDRIRLDMMEENEFTINLHDTIFSGVHKEMLDVLQEVTGIKGVTPYIDHEIGRFLGLSLRVEKNMDLSEVIEILLRNKLSIRAINTKEPTLEDAFIAITGNRVTVPERRVLS